MQSAITMPRHVVPRHAVPQRSRKAGQPSLVTRPDGPGTRPVTGRRHLPPHKAKICSSHSSCAPLSAPAPRGPSLRAPSAPLSANAAGDGTKRAPLPRPILARDQEILSARIYCPTNPRSSPTHAMPSSANHQARHAYASRPPPSFPPPVVVEHRGILKFPRPRPAIKGAPSLTGASPCHLSCHQQNQSTTTHLTAKLHPPTIPATH